jgi:hypothetical protein
MMAAWALEGVLESAFFMLYWDGGSGTAESRHAASDDSAVIIDPVVAVYSVIWGWWL